LAFRFPSSEEHHVTDVEHENNSSHSPQGEVPGQRRKSGSSRLAGLLANIRSTRTGRLTFRIAVGVLGAVIIAVGIVLLPLPGPGWLIIFAGLALWSIEFRWARRLRRFTQRQVSTWTTWYASQGWLIRILVGFATLLLVVAIIGVSLRISFGPDVFSRILSIF
jgi:uncharacterized protein (TIGR02611 family)